MLGTAAHPAGIVMSDQPENAKAAASAPEELAPPQRQRVVDVLSADVTPQVDAAARKLIAGGDALLVKTSRSAVHGFVLDQDHYDTRLEWTPTELIAICPCPTRAGGFVCPHLWATVLLADRSGAFRGLEEAHAHPVFSRSGEQREGRRAAAAWPARAGWKIHLASIAQAGARQAAETAPPAAGLPRQAVYVVDAAATRASHLAPGGRPAVMVELQSRQQKKSRARGGGENGGGNGNGWTKPAPFRPDAGEIETFFEAEDREILARIVGARPEESAAPGNGAGAAGNVCALRGAVGIELLKRMCETGRCQLRVANPLNVPASGEDYVALRWDDGPAYQFVVRIAAHDDGRHFTLSGHLSREGVMSPVTTAHLLAEPAPSATGGGGLAFIGDTVARADLAGGLVWTELFATRGPLHVPIGDMPEFLRQVAALPAIPRFDLPENLQFEQTVGTPRPRLIVRRPPRNGGSAGAVGRTEETVQASVVFDYDSGVVDAHATAAGTFDPAAGKMILRDRAAEARAMAVVKGLGFRTQVDPETHETRYELASRLLPGAVPTLIREGWIVEAEGKLYRAATDFRVSVTSGIDWFDLSGSVQFGDQAVSLPRLLAAARKGEHLIKLADGTFGVLPEEWLARYGIIVQSSTAAKDEEGNETIRFSRAQAGLLDVLLESQPHAAVDETFENLRTRLRQFGGIAAQEAPAGFVGTLRPYQKDGLGWFDFLRQFRFGGCLADDMGLGKTIQVLALLAARRGREGRGNGTGNGMAAKTPSLVVAPRSLVFNWHEEAMRFAPGLRILDHTGPSRIRATDHFADCDLILTTYGTLRSDIVFLKDYRFDYAILDEAQAIKNAQTESAKAVRLLQADYRLTLSGTPVQNHLGELWSLFEYLNPGMLGAAAVFDARYEPTRLAPPAGQTQDSAPEQGLPADTAAGEPIAAVPAEEEPEESPRQLLARALRPFILRRTKEQVAQELPACTEQTIYCELDNTQRTMYDELRDHYRQTLLTGRNGGGRHDRMQVLEALLRLRQAACHPGLIDKTRVGEPSAKLDTLFAQINEILEENHKALVFSQFTSLLAIVRQRLDHPPAGVTPPRYAYLDGKTRDRKSPVEQFQNDPATRLFLISLKAGGLGLNLTGADYVFLLDPWWNPAVEAQAIDRAHRIGQTRHVFAYRLIAKDTVEEKVMQLQQTKRDLADAIISEDNAILSNLTADDLAVLLS
jgi:superfamily II DNA or RNA helicase